MLTFAEILALPDRRVDAQFSTATQELLWDRNQDLQFFDENNGVFDDQGDAAQKLKARFSTHVKYEEYPDIGEGRTAVEVICVDQKPVATCFIDGGKSLTFSFCVHDCALLDEVVAEALALRIPQTRPVQCVQLTEENPWSFGVHRPIT